MLKEEYHSMIKPIISKMDTVQINSDNLKSDPLNKEVGKHRLYVNET